MKTSQLKYDTMREIDHLVERVARKAGYSDGQKTYKEHLQLQYEQQRENLKRKFKKYKRKLSLKPEQCDFSEEIKTYLGDGIIDLMAEGLSEEEALQITLQKFDEAELTDNFDDFMKSFDDFGVEEFKIKTQQWYAAHGDVVGLFYGAFFILGIVIGALIGFLSGGGWPVFLVTGWINTLIGVVVGAGIGIGLGLLSHAIIAAIIK
ncbi:MAG: hypothetical protein LBK69_02335 [Syntrophomonadaceae bacterium]|jgi:hypothetical protein|nr:hypothetical protein [Syntrophomonadaceae bacterium]